MLAAFFLGLVLKDWRAASVGEDVAQIAVAFRWSPPAPCRFVRSLFCLSAQQFGVKNVHC
jgi:hypothetical protein